jgi:hypothetical protein
MVKERRIGSNLYKTAIHSQRNGRTLMASGLDCAAGGLSYHLCGMQLAQSGHHPRLAHHP